MVDQSLRDDAVLAAPTGLPIAAARAVLRAGRRCRSRGLIWLLRRSRCRPAALARRSRSGRAVRGDAAVAGDRLLERDHRLLHHALRARSGGRRHARCGARARRRADHRLDRDPGLHPQRGRRSASLRNLDAADGRASPPPASAAASTLYILSDTDDPAIAAAEETRFAALATDVARPHRRHLSPPRREHRLQGRQHPRLLRALGRATTTSRSCSTPTA